MASQDELPADYPRRIQRDGKPAKGGRGDKRPSKSGTSKGSSDKSASRSRKVSESESRKGNPAASGKRKPTPGSKRRPATMSSVGANNSPAARSESGAHAGAGVHSRPRANARTASAGSHSGRSGRAGNSAGSHGGNTHNTHNARNSHNSGNFGSAASNSKRTAANNGKRSIKNSKLMAPASPSKPPMMQAGFEETSPKKMRHPALVVIGVIVALIVVFYAVDAAGSSGVIHAGVTVGGIDVGGMTVEQATAVIDDNFEPAVDQGNIIFYPSEDAIGSTEDPVEITFDYDVLESLRQNTPKNAVFEVSPDTLGAMIDGQALAQEAYNVGRCSDFLLGRIQANTLGKDVPVKVAMDGNSIEAVSSILTSSYGNAMVNYGIAFQDGAFTVTDGSDGYMVDDEALANSINKSLMGTDRNVVVSMVDVPMQIDSNAASDAAKKAQEAIANPVNLLYGNSTWTLDAPVLGQMVSTYVSEGFGGNSLVPYISLAKVQQVIPTLQGIGNIGTPAQNVHFSYDGSQLNYTPAATGIGPDYVTITERLNSIVFGDQNLPKSAGEITDEDETQQGTDFSQEDSARQVTMKLVTLEPTLTYDDAVRMGLTSSMIASYTTQFSGSGNKITNIKLLSDILTNTIIAPGETFSINGVAGECNAEKGFKEAGSILNGGVTSEIGGGICQVATTVFNASFKAGYPIVERHNHSTYMPTYPDGLDAAISWPYLDLKFKNNTDNYIMLLVDYNDYSVTCSLWGISPGYSTGYQTTDWEEGEAYPTKTVVDDTLTPGTQYVKTSGRDGHTITIVRSTFAADGSLLYKDTFVSLYQPRTQVVVKGPDPVPEESESDSGSSGGSGSESSGSTSSTSGSGGSSSSASSGGSSSSSN